MPIENFACLMFFIMGLITSAMIYRIRVEELKMQRNYWRDAYLEERARDIKGVNRG